MTDQINDQISAFIDNELPAEESALLVRRFERDSDARARAMRYTLIGAALRGELLEPHPSVLRRRLAAALSGAVVSGAPKARDRGGRWARPLLGVGIAATVAVVAIGALRSLNDAALGSANAPPVAALPSAVLDAGLGAAYVVPQDTDLSGTLAPITLTNYLMHHGEFASGFTRTSVSSNVVGGAMEPVSTDTAVAKPIPAAEEEPE